MNHHSGCPCCLDRLDHQHQDPPWQASPSSHPKALHTDTIPVSLSNPNHKPARNMPFPLFFDGAMGTYYNSMEGCEMESPESGCLHRPDLIEAIHKQYIEAGANAIKTCTFGLTSLLEKGDQEQAAKIAQAAVHAARSAIEKAQAEPLKKRDSDHDPSAQGDNSPIPAEKNEDHFCNQADGSHEAPSWFASQRFFKNPGDQNNSGQESGSPYACRKSLENSVDLCHSSQNMAEDSDVKQTRSDSSPAPFSMIELFGDIGPASTYENAGALYIKQAKLFYELGIRCFLVETLSADYGIEELAKWLSEQKEPVFLLVSYAIGADGCTRSGQEGKSLLIKTASIPGVHAVGYNCLSGPHHLYTLQKDLPELPVPLSIMPNAGYPSIVGRKVQYEGSPAYFGSVMHQIFCSGASIIGGCCGTTPAHIRQMVVEAQKPCSLPDQQETGTSSFVHQSDSLYEKFFQNKKVVAVELDPPKNDRIAPFMEHVGLLSRSGADFITIADCPIGRPRADSSLLACKIRRELGVDVLPHMTCRDRNLNAIKALLLGLSMEDLHSVLLVTGDPLPSELRNEVQSVFSFHSRQLASYISSLQPDTISSPFHIFGALNVNAPNFDVQLKIAKEKEANGMVGFLTQPIHSKRALENLKRARRELKGKLLGGILPIVSERNARFLQNEIGGMEIDERLVDLYKGKNRQEAEKAAVTICLETAKAMADYTDGFYIMTPFSRVSLVCAILEQMQKEQLIPAIQKES